MAAATANRLILRRDTHLDSLPRQSERQSLGVVFFGGEPLLCMDLIRSVISHCRDIEARTGQLFHFKVTTNGTLLDEQFLTDALTKDVFVALGHDGVRSAHDTPRGRGGQRYMGESCSRNGTATQA